MVQKLRKLIKIIQRWSFKSDRVTKYLDYQLKFLDILGLFQLPNVLNGKSKSLQFLRQLHKSFTFFLLGTIITLNYLCVLIKSSKEFIEFSTVFMEVVATTLVFIEMVFFNLKRRELGELLSRMNHSDLTCNRRVAICRRLERICFFMMNGTIFVITFIKLVEPFFPISFKSAQEIQSIYGLKYPQNRLPFCLWIPLIDTSEPSCFFGLYFIQLYVGFLVFASSTNAVMFFPLIILHLVKQHFVLAGRLESLGKTQLRKASRVRHKLSDQESQRLKILHDVLEMKKCIVLHQKLLEFRALYDYISQNTTTLRALLLLIITSISSYVISVLSEFDSQKGSVLLVEFILILSCFYFLCILSEILEWMNCRIRRSIYQSQWYRMAPEAQRMMVMFLRRTQRPHYVRILHGMIVLGNVVFVRTLKMIFSFVQCVHISRK
ncbi:hypothetical protein WDU94_002518 [Cyamophila willieti]